MSDFYVEIINNGKTRYHERGAGTVNDGFVVNTAQQALGMIRDFAIARAGMYRKSGYKARVVQAQSRNQLNNAIVVVDWNEDLLPKNEGLTLRNNFVESVYRDTFEGRSLELPILFNRSLGTYFLKFTTSTNPLDPPDVSVPGKTPLECFQKFTENPVYRPYHDRFDVEPFKPTPPVPIEAGPDEFFVQFPGRGVVLMKKT